MRKIAFLLALLSLPLAALLAPPLQSETSLGELRFQIDPALRGGGSLYIPVADWGIRFPLHDAPFSVRSEVRSINRDGLILAAAGDETTLRASEKEIRSAAFSTIFRVWLLAILIAAVLGVVVDQLFRLRGLERTSALFAALLGTALFLLALLTHSSQALERPSFYARGAELEQILNVVSDDGPRGSYEDNFREVIANVSSFLSKGATRVPEGREVILASDLHSNALALSALQEFVGSKPVFFVGDFALEGNDAEAVLLSQRVASLGGRVVATSGNHDSALLMQNLAEAGVEVLGKRGRLLPDGSWQPGAIEVDGLRVRAWDDPLLWEGEPSDPSRQYSLSDEEMKAEGEELWDWWRALPEKPDILLLHQPALAEDLARRLSRYPRPLSILVGHDHDQWAARNNNVRIADAGSVGAGGIFGLGREMAEIASLRYSESSPTLRSADMIAVSPLDGRASAERVVWSEICSLPCRYRVRSIR